MRTGYLIESRNLKALFFCLFSVIVLFICYNVSIRIVNIHFKRKKRDFFFPAICSAISLMSEPEICKELLGKRTFLCWPGSPPTPFWCTRDEDIVSGAAHNEILGRYSALSLLLWGSAEHPQRCPVSGGCRYRSLSGFQGILNTLFLSECLDLGWFMPFFTPAQFIFSEFWLWNDFVSAQAEIHKCIFFVMQF